MSQPFNRAAQIPQPIELDEELGEWWEENPWAVAEEGHNLSAYERNRVYLNADGEDFYDISALTTADSDGDGRSVVAADMNGDGMQDLLVRQSGGGPLLYFENRVPPANWLQVSLRGTQSNTLGIGARIVAEVGERRIVRELYPANGFRCQGPARVHFGLADAETVDELTIHWPSGAEQVLTDVAANRHVRVTEGSEALETR